MSSATTSTMTLNEGYFVRRNWFDWLFAALVVMGGVFALQRYYGAMDVYEKGILIGTIPTMIWLGWFWRPLAKLMLAVAALSLLAIWLYQGPDGVAHIDRSDTVFGLKYLLSSQSAILWMSVLCFMATIFYWISLFAKGERDAFGTIGSRITWVAITLALVGTMTRWFESYLLGPDIGHIPVSNLYEVFVMFIWMTSLFYLYYEEQYKTRSLGGFVMLVVSAAVGFLLWYTVIREAHEIQPLVPALQSWWMKVHVPANFVGYGTFALAAMVAFAYLIKQQAQETKWYKLAPLWLLGVALCFEPLAFRQSQETGSSYWLVYFGISALIVGAILAARKTIAARLPAFEVLDDVMYKSIAVGFAFFTIATVLGALWAAEAWGGYWSWDPKETWALIVWLNYAAWLHMRLMKGLRGTVSAWWALVGLAITTFAFLGVNMFLSGLHSYGEL
ncbi:MULTISPECIES: c-type cytochrome biogenesis protein CcsB [Comamonas]|uniref:C-type cytochrome biogenesis protein CcsB n=1 Tax=Comamonas avium TaxID=2762231 RepID=A0ABR8S9X3_9BURK|nr:MULTISPECIES: c-type cytochrome biogenesis protein CcsB [Comamonas]MBD7960240.1 c-type cytochrome biogenesis protein CcsB [Comamonas avium]MBD9400559.1 c-type cytochrome biogenesis protein CcsB [Comamonas sp. CMM02]